MMNKELFVKSMGNLQKYMEWEHKLYELGINFWEREEIANLVTSYLDLLAYTCHERYEEDGYEDYNDIDYFIYEQEFGAKSDEYFLTEADGTEVKLHNADELWEYIVKVHPEINDKEITPKNDPKKGVNFSNEESINTPHKTLTMDEFAEILVDNFGK